MFQQHQIILQRYRVISRAGSGGNATVLHAYDNKLKRDVAIKCIQLSDVELSKISAEKGAGRISSSGNSGAAISQGDVATISAAGFDDALPGMIAGAGKAQIEGVGADDVAVQIEDVPSAAGSSRSSGTSGSSDSGAFTFNAPPDMTISMPSFLEKKKRRQNGNRTGATMIFGGATNSDDNAAAVASDAEDALSVEEATVSGMEEARAAAKLNDPNIVTVYDCVVEGNQAFVIMEYVEGRTLARIMRELENDITLDMISNVFASVSHALEVAHSKNMLHLDIKPENVIVNKSGQVKVTDFGLATLMDAGGFGHAGGGTIGYMPLEQMRMQALDVRTDEWALASLTYEMLSGSNPFKAGSLKAAESAIENAELVLPSQCWPDVSDEMNDIMFKALDPVPEDRFATVKAFAKKLQPLLGDSKEGKKQLASVVNGDFDEVDEEAFAADAVEDSVAGNVGNGKGKGRRWNKKVKPEAEPREPGAPLVDALGPRGANIIMRVASAVGAAMIGAISLLNIRLDISDMYGLLSNFPIVFWALLVGIVAAAAIKPKVGMPIAFAALVTMLFFNHAWALASAVLIAVAAWWWFVGRAGDDACAIAMLQPLLGSFGFAAFVSVISGVALDIKQACSTVLLASVTAVAFAALGSCNIYMWDVFSNALTPANAEIAANAINDSLIKMLTNPVVYVGAASWVLGATAYSLFCRKGSKVFDVLGSCVCAALLIAGSLGNVICGATAPDALALAATIVCGLVGIVLAAMNFPDRVRLAPGEW